MEQIAFADQIVLNKTELASEPELAAIEQRLRRLNPFAPILRAVRADVPLDAILGRGAFDLDRIVSLEPHILDSACDAPGHVHDEHCGHDHGHHSQDYAAASHLADSDIRSVSLTATSALDYNKVGTWLATLIEMQGRDILRAEGHRRYRG